MGIGAIHGVIEETLRQQYGITGAGGVATMVAPVLTSPVLNTPDINDPDIDGGTIDGVEVTGELVDATTFLVDDADPTKRLSFELGAISTGTDIVMTPPSANDTLIGSAAVQTITGAKTFGAAGAVGKLKVAGTTSGAVTIDAAAVAGTDVLTLPAGTDTLVALAATQTLTNKTLTAPVMSGSVTGTYTLAGTPTVANGIFSNSTHTGVETKGAVSAAAGSIGTTTKLNTALADNTVADAFVVTVPNAIHGGAVRVTTCGILGDGDSTDSKVYMVGISRIADADAKAVISAAAAVGATAGAGANSVVTASVTAMTGAAGATQTFTIQVKVARSAGASTNHVVVSEAVLLNGFATGITIAAA